MLSKQEDQADGSVQFGGGQIGFKVDWSLHIGRGLRGFSLLMPTACSFLRRGPQRPYSRDHSASSCQWLLWTPSWHDQCGLYSSD